MSSVGLCACVSYTESQVLVCVLVYLTLCVMRRSVLLRLLQCVSRVGLCSCVSDTVCQGLACVIVSLHCVRRFLLCSCVSLTVCKGLVCVLVSLILCVNAWPVLLFFLH